ncbi:MAG: sodium/proton-translocating pyrophosphatase, partial [Armatimonadota bacterium]
MRSGVAIAFWLLGVAGAYAGEAVELPPFGPTEQAILGLVLLMAFAALAFGGYLLWWTLKQPAGTPKMQEVAAAIQAGANAYLKRQFKTMIWFVLLITVGLFALYYPVYQRVYPEDALRLAFGIALAFFLGVFASYGAGYVGMYMAVRGNVRTAAKALTTFKGALETAFRAGAVSG